MSDADGIVEFDELKNSLMILLSSQFVKCSGVLTSPSLVDFLNLTLYEKRNDAFLHDMHARRLIVRYSDLGTSRCTDK
jgi:hypothetical protein